MLSIDSSRWRLRVYNDAYAHITQRASGTVHTIMRGKLPSGEALASMSETRFNAVLRDAFHGVAIDELYRELT